MSVRSTLEAYASGTKSLDAAKTELQSANWDITRHLTEAQLTGVVDTPPPSDNSPDWIQLVPGLPQAARLAFTAIFDARRP